MGFFFFLGGGVRGVEALGLTGLGFRADGFRVEGLSTF